MLAAWLPISSCRRTSALESPANHTSFNAPSAPTVESPPPKAPVSAPAASGIACPTVPPPAGNAETLPPLPVGQVETIAVPGDRPVLVAHADAGNRRAIVYLHGVCGNIDAMRSWATAASQWGTVIAVYGDLPCKGRPRFRWSLDVRGIDRRIQGALERVAELRHGALDTEALVVVGYSQGASRAEQLAAYKPERYRWVVLAGAPQKPELQNLVQAQAVALVIGQLEGKAHVRESLQQLQQAGKPVRLFVLPQAGHGEFGPRGDEVMADALRWLLQSR